MAVTENTIPPELNSKAPEEIKTNLSVDLSKSIISKLGDTGNNLNLDSSKKENKSYIYDYIAKYNIEEVPVSNLQKLQEKELINVPFFQKLRKKINPQMIKSKLMKGLGIRESYTGFHEFMKGDRADLPNVGICNIAKTIGYDVMILPIPENITKLEMDRLNVYKEAFLLAVEDKIKELNIPVTRTRTKDKEKPKEVNSQFIENLAKTNEDFLAEIKENVSNVSDINIDTGIGIDDVFDDKGGAIEFEPKPFIKKSSKVEKTFEDGFDIDNNLIKEFDNLDDNFLNSSILFNPDNIEFESYDEEFKFHNFDCENNHLEFDGLKDNFIDTKVKKIDMSGYSDSLDDFRKIGEDLDDDFNIENK